MTYRFGAFLLDADAMELRGPAGRVDMEPQVFALLLHLIDNRARVAETQLLALNCICDLIDKQLFGGP